LFEEQFDMESGAALDRLNQIIIQCRKCPRLVAYLQEVPGHKPKRFREWDYWAKPLPGFGDPRARALVVGLAPAAHGGNRTGRMFTGDRSGEWLFRALHAFGFANQPASTRVDDGFELIDCYITATIRCAPPANKPLPGEIENCRPYLMEELDLLKEIRLFIPLGQIAFSQILKVLRMRGMDIPPLPFGHGKVFPLSSGQTIITTYHPSQQNTQTGKLTQAMFHQVFKTARARLENEG
jgi:uracil-DNA glycosylase